MLWISAIKIMRILVQKKLIENSSIEAVSSRPAPHHVTKISTLTFSETNEQKIWILLQANMEKRTFMREEEEAKIEILFC